MQDMMSPFDNLARWCDFVSVAVQDAVHDKMLNTSRVLKRDPAQPAQLHPAGASPPQAARSAPQVAGPGGRQLARLSSSHGASAAQPERQPGDKHDEPGMQHLQPPAPSCFPCCDLVSC